MKKGVALLRLLLLASVAILYFFVFNKKKPSEAPDPVRQNSLSVTSKHSEAFNKSVDNFMNAYYAMIEGFVNWDTGVVKKGSVSFKTALDSFKIDELKKDTLTYEEAERVWNAIKAETVAIAEDNNLDEQRGSLNIL